MMKILVSGSRNHSDYELLKSILSRFGENVEIIHGNASGIDSDADRYSNEELGKEATVFPADWKDLSHPDAIIKYNNHGAYNANAGMSRNAEMGNIADILVAIRKNNSKGTTNMINYMINLGKPVIVKDV